MVPQGFEEISICTSAQGRMASPLSRSRTRLPHDPESCPIVVCSDSRCSWAS